VFPITILLLTVGALLAACGTLGFTAVATTAPHPTDLRIARRIATTGRWASSIGLLALCTSGTALAGATLAAALAVIALAVASILTKAPLHYTPATTHPDP
jgi:hypothetical protein